jgi:hypothetical protein
MLIIVLKYYVAVTLAVHRCCGTCVSVICNNGLLVSYLREGYVVCSCTIFVIVMLQHFLVLLSPSFCAVFS